MDDDRFASAPSKTTTTKLVSCISSRTFLVSGSHCIGRVCTGNGGAVEDLSTYRNEEGREKRKVSSLGLNSVSVGEITEKFRAPASASCDWSIRRYSHVIFSTSSICEVLQSR